MAGKGSFVSGAELTEEVQAAEEEEKKMCIRDRVCERAQYALWNRFWDNEKEVFVKHYPVNEEESWIYWWHAHALDALLDGFVRTKETYYLERFEAE